MDGLLAEVLFPNMQVGPRLWRGIADDDLYRATVRAYNDWLGEEYCPVSRDRLIGLGVIPWSGLDDAVAELHHCAKLGLRKGDDIERTERRGNTAASSEFDLRCALHELLSRAHPNLIRAVGNDGCAHLLYSGKRSRPPGQLRKRTEISMTAGDRDHAPEG